VIATAPNVGSTQEIRRIISAPQFSQIWRLQTQYRRGGHQICGATIFHACHARRFNVLGALSWVRLPKNENAFALCEHPNG
jgi:hypothetical protein